MSQQILPEGWQWVRLGDLLLSQETVNPRLNPDDEFLYVDIASVDQPSRNLSIIPRSISGKEAPSRARKALHTGDVIYATTRPYLKHIMLIDSQLDGQICSTGFCVLRPGTKVLSEYLYYITQTSLFQDQVVPKMRGSNYPAVSDQDVFDALIPLTSIPVQLAMVTILNKARSVCDKREEAHELTMQAGNALFAEILGNPATNPKDWPEFPLGSILEGVRRPIYTNANDNYRQVTIRWYGKGASIRKHGLGSERKIERQYLVKRDDFIYSRIDARKGAFAIAGDNIDNCIVTSDFPTFKINNLVMVSYLEAFIKLPYFWNLCAQVSSGTTRRARLNEEKLMKIKIPVPPLTEQHRFIQANDQLSTFILKQGVGEIDADALFSSVLTRAFTGELTSEWETTHAGRIAAEVERLEQRPRLALLELIALRQRRRSESVGITCLMKYVFLAQMQGMNFKQSGERLYDFVPYHFGPFVRNLYEDLATLEAEGWVTVKRTNDEASEQVDIHLNAERSAEIETVLAGLSEGEKDDLINIIEQYGDLSHNDLLERVYSQYPAYARISRLQKKSIQS